MTQRTFRNAGYAVPQQPERQPPRAPPAHQAGESKGGSGVRDAEHWDKEPKLMITQLTRWLGRGQPAERHCRDCGAVVPTGESLCPRCHGMEIDEGRRNTYQEAERERFLHKS